MNQKITVKFCDLDTGIDITKEKWCEHKIEILRDMNEPFEGLLGNCDELKIIEYLLPLNGIKFNITELSQDLEISVSKITEIVDKFVEWKLLKSITEENIKYYCINHESPIVKSIEQFNNALIENILGDEILYEIHDYWEEMNRKSLPK